jgi:hypothetical protein
MPRSPRSVIFVLAAAAVGASSVIFGATAAKAADTITVSASSPATAAAKLSVVVDSTTQLQLTSLKVHLLDATNADVMDPAMTTGNANVPITGGYQSTFTVTIAEGTLPAGLPLGVYTVTVDAADAGTSITGTKAGTLNFVDEPTITISADHMVVSYDAPTVKISGQVTLLAPDGTRSPYAGSPLMIIPSFGNGVITVNTDASGDYTETVSPLGGDTIFATLNPTATMGSAISPTVTFTLHQDPVKVAARLSAKTIVYGTKETLSGTVTYEPGQTYMPLGHREVQIYGTTSANPIATPVTNSNGQFSVVLPKADVSTSWEVDAGGGAGYPYLGPAITYLPETVKLPAAITGFKVTLSQYWQVTVHGCLGLKNGVPAVAVTQVSGVTIQYAERPTGPWYKLGTVKQTNGVECGHAGVTFSGTLPAQVNYAYYRAYYPGGSGLIGTDYLPAASGSLLVWKYADRIVNFSVSARAVGANGRLTVKGQLQYYYSNWHAYRNQTVFIVFRPKGSSTWYWIVKPRTNSAGWFSGTFADPVSATWSALFEGNSTHLAASPPGIYVGVTGSTQFVASTFSTTVLHAIDTLSFSGSLRRAVSP